MRIAVLMRAIIRQTLPSLKLCLFDFPGVPTLERFKVLPSALLLAMILAPSRYRIKSLG